MALRRRSSWTVRSCCIFLFFSTASVYLFARYFNLLNEETVHNKFYANTGREKPQWEDQESRRADSAWAREMLQRPGTDGGLVGKGASESGGGGGGGRGADLVGLQDTIAVLARQISQLAERQQMHLDRQAAELRQMQARMPNWTVHETPAYIAKQVEVQGAVISELRAKLAALEVARDKTIVLTEDKSVKKLARDPAGWRQHSFDRHGAYGYIRYSSYRMNATSFASVGMALQYHHFKRVIGPCRWEGKDGESVVGHLSPTFTHEHHELMYEVCMLICVFPKRIPLGGFVIANVDLEEFVMYREEPGQLESIDAEPPFISRLTVCCAPIHGKGLKAVRVREFVEYHKLQGADHFLFYDSGGVTPELLEIFDKDIREGTVEIIPYKENEEYDMWYHGQLLAQNDCIYRSRYTANWVMSADFDEYIWLRRGKSKRGELVDFLDTHTGTAVLTHGCLWFDIFKCRSNEEQESELSGRNLGVVAEEGDKFLVEDFAFRWPNPVCWHNGEEGWEKLDERWCPADRGHRKFFVNPRMVERMGVHGFVKEEEVPPSTTVLSTDDVAHAHFQYLLGNDVRCNETVPNTQSLVWWAVDYDFVENLRRLKRHHSCNLTGDGCIELPPTVQ